MKIIYLILMLALVHTASAQDFCKLIKKEASEDKTTFDLASPFDPTDVPPLRVMRNYNTNPEYLSDNFYLIFYMTGDLEGIYVKTANGEQEEKEEKKLVIQFEDNTKILDDSIKVIHDRTDDKIQAVRYVYYPMTDKNLTEFTTKKITKFSLAGFEQTIVPDSANAVMHYIQCIKAAK